MANTEQLYIDLELLESQAQDTIPVLGGLEGVLKKVSQAIREAFSIGGYRDYLQTVGRFGKALTDELLVLQLSFGKLRVAIADAFAPIAAVVVPAINEAIAALTVFAQFLGQLLRELLYAATGQDLLADGTRNLSREEKKLAATANRAGSALRRSLMPFDQLNRLAARSGSGGSSPIGQILYVPDEISSQVKNLVDKILYYLKPLLELDFAPLRESLARLGQQFESLGSSVGSAMQWLWFEILTPFAGWITQTLAPVLVDGWAAGLELVQAAVEPVISAMDALWAALEPVVAFIGTEVVDCLTIWRQTFENLGQVIRSHGTQINATLESVAQGMSWLWQQVSPVLQVLADGFGRSFAIMGQAATAMTDSILTALTGLANVLEGSFTSDWQQAWSGLLQYLRGIVNGVVGLLNTMIARLSSALNAVIGVVNGMRFTVPRWVPGIGGESFGFNLPYVSTPQIPYLARGAVLPANQPFLAVVGDQRHGTNVEAPLSTIQEAVSLVMDGHVQAMMAGFEALLAENRALRQTVEGIELGDTVIGQAAHRYNRNLAVMRGV